LLFCFIYILIVQGLIFKEPFNFALLNIGTQTNISGKIASKLALTSWNVPNLLQTLLRSLTLFKIGKLSSHTQNDPNAVCDSTQNCLLRIPGVLES